MAGHFKDLIKMQDKELRDLRQEVLKSVMAQSNFFGDRGQIVEKLGQLRQLRQLRQLKYLQCFTHFDHFADV